MKFLLDVNLSPKLAVELQDLFPGSTHVYRRGLGSRDDLIWAFARDHEFTLLSKDADFYRSSMLHGAPPKVVWLRAEPDRRSDPQALVGSLRRIAGIGPAYEVLRIIDDRNAPILVLESGQEADYPIADVLLDPGLSA